MNRKPREIKQNNKTQKVFAMNLNYSEYVGRRREEGKIGED